MPQWNNWHMTFSPDRVRSFLSMWSDSELCSVMLNAVDRSTRQHPKPLAWDFVFPRTKALYSLRLWSPVSGELWLFDYTPSCHTLNISECCRTPKERCKILMSINHIWYFTQISLSSVQILIRSCARNFIVSQSDLLTKKKHFEISSGSFY